MTQKIAKSFGTHNGTFHADEVTACALLLLFNFIDRKKIYRTRDKEILARCDYVCDVGGCYEPTKKLFDHHQIDYQGELSSAGMVLLYLLEQEVISQKEWRFFNDTLIMGVDAHDNGRETKVPGVSTYSHIIANFTPIPRDAPEKVQDDAFQEALDFVLGHLKRMHQRFQYIESCRETVKKAMSDNNFCLMFDKAIPWQELFFEMDGVHHPAKFIIMPSGGHWNLRGIPPSLEKRMDVRQPFPENWAGLLEDDLQKETGIKGAVFCHKGRFISVWQTKEDALKALQLVTKENV